MARGKLWFLLPRVDNQVGLAPFQNSFEIDAVQEIDFGAAKYALTMPGYILRMGKEENVWHVVVEVAKIRVGYSGLYTLVWHVGLVLSLHFVTDISDDPDIRNVLLEPLGP